MIEATFVSSDRAKELVAELCLFPFQEPFWWDVITKGFSKECKVVVVSDKGVNQLLLPIFFHKLGPFVRAGAPLRGTHTPHIDPIVLSKGVDITSQQLYVEKIFSFLLANGADWIEFTFSDHQILGGLNESDYLVEDPYTSVLKTNTNENVLWDGMQGRARNLIRKAEKNGLVVKVLDADSRNIGVFYNMLEFTFQKSGNKPPHPKEFYAFLVDRLIASNNLLFLSIEKESKVIAMGVFMFNSSEINFTSGASTYEGNKYGANNLLHWEVIKFASTNNIKQYNFGGLGIPAIDKFKRSFGGRDVYYKRYIWMKPVVRRLFNVATTAKDILFIIRHKLSVYRSHKP